MGLYISNLSLQAFKGELKPHIHMSLYASNTLLNCVLPSACPAPASSHVLQLLSQGSTLRKNFISPEGLVTETLTSPEIFLLALILMTTLFK